MTEFFTETILPWIINPGLKLIAITVGIYIAHKFIDKLIEKSIRKLIPSERFSSKSEEEQREDTLIQVATVTLHVILWIVGGMILLSELGVNIGPLIAAAGIGGLAFGFGGQYLIRDIINGLFILLENQFGVGDVACFGTTCGVVESINLRRTVLRDLDGAVHTVPNGEIAIASNLSDDYARVNLDIGVGYSTNLEDAMRVINRVGLELAKDPEWRDKIKTPPEFLRVDEFGDSAIMIKIMGETIPMEQWAITGELRKRLKMAFDQEGIEIPFPQRVIHQSK